MGALEAYAALAAAHPAADYAVVYLEEAHPTTGWMYPAVTHFTPPHASLQDRIDNAKTLVEALPASCPIYADGFDDPCSKAFGALPERLVLLLDGEVLFVGGKGPDEYSVPEAAAALKKVLAGHSGDEAA